MELKPGQDRPEIFRQETPRTRMLRECNLPPELVAIPLKNRATKGDPASQNRKWFDHSFGDRVTDIT